MNSLNKFTLCISIYRLSESKEISFNDLVKLFPGYNEKRFENTEITIKNQTLTCKATVNEYYDMYLIIKLYKNWKHGNEICTQIGGRKMNIPECLSEYLFCFHTGCIIIKDTKKIKSSTSFDCYNPLTSKTVQLKCSSVYKDLSSFGPKSEWEELYFMFIDINTDSYKIWYIDSNLLYDCKVNFNTTFRQQQNTGKRPRLSIRKCLIEKYDIQPIGIGTIL